MICLFLVEIKVRNFKIYIFYINNAFQYYLNPCTSIFDKDYSTYFVIFVQAGLNTWPLTWKHYETLGTFYRTIGINIRATSI